MKRKGFSVVIRRILLGIWAAWAVPLVLGYQEPKRAGTPHGEKIGLSRSKYFCALLQALHGPFGLPNLSKSSFEINLKGLELHGASLELLNKWRTEKGFRDVGETASHDFAEIMLQEVKSSFEKEDYVKGLCLFEALMMMPAVNSIKNRLNELVCKDPEYQSCYNDIINEYGN